MLSIETTIETKEVHKLVGRGFKAKLVPTGETKEYKAITVSNGAMLCSFPEKEVIRDALKHANKRASYDSTLHKAAYVLSTTPEEVFKALVKYMQENNHA